MLSGELPHNFYTDLGRQKAHRLLISPLVECLMSSSQTTSPLLNLSKLRCERDDRVLFEQLECEIAAGDVVQIQGPNGSGKTSLLRIILGLSQEFEGDIQWRGQPMAKSLIDFRQNLLYIGHLPAINRSLSPLENLQWFGCLSGEVTIEALESALTAVGLRGFEDVPGHHLSAGQHRRVALARLYLSKAQLWILDEPFTAIDVQGVDKLRQQFAKHVEQGGAVIVTTHQDLGIDGVKMLDLADFIPARKKEVA